MKIETCDGDAMKLRLSRCRVVLLYGKELNRVYEDVKG